MKRKHPKKSTPSLRSKALWSGRFDEKPDPLLQQFTESVSFDWRLYRHDIAGSIAHATMLHRIGILTGRELRDIRKGLLEIQSEIDSGKFTWSVEREDVHMNIEAVLTARVPAGAKLHTGRSRNDQVATDMRLWLRDEIAKNRCEIRALQQSLARWASRDQDVIIPGYTHLQRAQPVLLAHHLLAYAEMLERDAERFADCARRANILPLGSGAIAGSTLPLDRPFLARELGFDGISQNSMDAVSDRDFVVEYCAAGALLAVHLSRLSEDIVLWSSAEFGFIELPDAFTTGSSLMPQKKNPDVAELARGKTGRVIGNLVSLLTLLKGLPMTYNRDLQEDKERLFDTADTVSDTLRIFTAMLANVTVLRERCAAAASDPLLLATDVADALVRKGMPFRRAHEITGRAVALAENLGVTIDALSLEDWHQIDSKVGPEVLHVFGVMRALEQRKMIGAPNPAHVKKQIKRWLGNHRD